MKEIPLAPKGSVLGKHRPLKCTDDSEASTCSLYAQDMPCHATREYRPFTFYYSEDSIRSKAQSWKVKTHDLEINKGTVWLPRLVWPLEFATELEVTSTLLCQGLCASSVSACSVPGGLFLFFGGFFCKASLLEGSPHEMRGEDPVFDSRTCAVGMLSARLPVLSSGNRAHIPPCLSCAQ